MQEHLHSRQYGEVNGMYNILMNTRWNNQTQVSCSSSGSISDQEYIISPAKDVNTQVPLPATHQTHKEFSKSPKKEERRLIKTNVKSGNGGEVRQEKINVQPTWTHVNDVHNAIKKQVLPTRRSKAAIVIDNIQHSQNTSVEHKCSPNTQPKSVDAKTSKSSPEEEDLSYALSRNHINPDFKYTWLLKAYKRANNIPEKTTPERDIIQAHPSQSYSQQIPLRLDKSELRLNLGHGKESTFVCLHNYDFRSHACNRTRPARNEDKLKSTSDSNAAITLSSASPEPTASNGNQEYRTKYRTVLTSSQPDRKRNIHSAYYSDQNKMFNHSHQHYIHKGNNFRYRDSEGLKYGNSLMLQKNVDRSAGDQEIITSKRKTSSARLARSKDSNVIESKLCQGDMPHSNMEQKQHKHQGWKLSSNEKYGSSNYPTTYTQIQNRKKAAQAWMETHLCSEHRPAKVLPVRNESPPIIKSIGRTPKAITLTEGKSNFSIFNG